MKKDDLIKCILIGFKEESIDDDNYTPEKWPIEGDEAQQAWEMGMMLAREGYDIKEWSTPSCMDDNLESILCDSASELTMKDLT